MMKFPHCVYVPIFHMQFSIICCSILPPDLSPIIHKFKLLQEKGGPLEPIPIFFKFFLQKTSVVVSSHLHSIGLKIVTPHSSDFTLVKVPTLLRVSIHVGM